MNSEERKILSDQLYKHNVYPREQELAMSEMERGTKPEKVAEAVMAQLDYPLLEDRARGIDRIRNAVNGYLSQLRKREMAASVEKNIETLLEDILWTLREVVRECSNAKVFRLYKADYSDEEIRDLNEMYSLAKRLNDLTPDFFSKAPKCGKRVADVRECPKECLFNTGKACRMISYEDRFARWEEEKLWH